ncbi:MAG TPA: hypothetical protein VMS43_07570 [Allosphingosinicella sp.]|nr:hypothetical protein [Allosphingosinicella sp.]
MPNRTVQDFEPAEERGEHYLPLEFLTGDSNLAHLLAPYLAPDAFADGVVECLPIRAARTRFSVREVAAGGRIFSATRGEHANVPVVMIPLDKLIDLVHDAEREVQEAPVSLVAALAPSADLPPASRIVVKSGSHVAKIRFMTKAAVEA